MSKKEKEARKLLKSGKFRDAIDKFNEAGRELHYAGQNQHAIELLEEGDKLAREHQALAEGSLCKRSLSEVYSTLGDREKSLQHVIAFRKLAVQSGSRSQEQISYHVEAWCLQQLYINGEAERSDIERAIELTKKSRELVGMYKKLFKPSEPGGLPHIRLSQLFTLEAQLQSLLENNSTALQLLDKADRLLKPNDKGTRHEVLRTKCSIVPVEKRVDIAELMDEDAPEEQKAQTLCELSHQYVLANRLERGYRTLAQAYIFHEKTLGRIALEDIIRRLCIIYRLVKYNKMLKKSNLPAKMSMCELHEAIGDLYDKYFQTLMDKEKKEYHQYTRDNILKNYEKMLEYKRSDSEALRAYLGMALVYGDLDDYSKSKSLFEKRLILLQNTGASEEKVLDARISIFNCMCKLEHVGLQRSFEDLEQKVSRFNNAKKELYEIWANYLSDSSQNEEAKKWRELSETIPDSFDRNADDETDFLYKTFSDEDILEKVKEDSELLKLSSLTEHQKNKTNDKGETILHQAAQKSDNDAKVEMLCRMGCKVDARDNGGWTPLFEAIAHDQLENVRVLIRYGADVNTRSAESFISEESQNSSDELNHSKLTPLMDACTNGYVDIAKLLIDNKARVDLKDSANWTAYQHLKRYIDENGADEKLMRFAEYLKDLTANCIPMLDDIPISVRKANQHEEVLSDDSPPDDVEDNIILGMVASRKRRNSKNFDSSLHSSKRFQRKSDENFRPSPHPPSSYRPVKKRSMQPSMEAYCQPKRFDRQMSSSSLTSIPRSSVSPRRSLSPAVTIRSAPSVFEEDVQFAGMRRPNGIPRATITTKTPSTVTTQRLVPSPKTQSDLQCSEMIVKCYFQLPPGSLSKEIRPFKLPFSRILSITEVKKSVSSTISSSYQYKIKSVWNKDDEDKCGVDELTLSQVADKPNQREVALVFELAAPQAHEVYQEISKSPISEVTNQLKLLSTEKKLDFSELFLSSLELSEVSKTLNKCEKPQNALVDLSFCELSLEDEANLQSLIDDSISLRISNTVSKAGLSGIFEKQKLKLKELELFGILFRDDSQAVKILNSCPNLKSLSFAGIRISSNSSSCSVIPLAITGLRNIVSLDLSFNSWISDYNWIQLFKGLEQLERLTMNEIKSDVQFESWLPNLSSFIARGSDLHWDSFFEKFSISDKMTRVDVRYSTIDSSLPQELRNVNPSITEILF